MMQLKHCKALFQGSEVFCNEGEKEVDFKKHIKGNKRQVGDDEIWW